MIKSFPKPNASHVKLSPYKYRQLMDKVFERDEWQCVECGSSTNLTLGHIKHKKMGGSAGPGDVIDNCETLCIKCHTRQEMTGRKQ